MRRNFQLRAGDEAFLLEQGFDFETLLEGSIKWLVIHDFECPPGLSAMTVSLALRIPANYPVGPLDMFFTHPALTYASGGVVPATEGREQLDGKAFQQWSRHRKGANAWRVGFDSIVTQLQLARAALLRDANQGITQ